MKTSIFHSLFIFLILAICLNGICEGNKEASSPTANAPPPLSFKSLLDSNTIDENENKNGNDNGTVGDNGHTNTSFEDSVSSSSSGSGSASLPSLSSAGHHPRSHKLSPSKSANNLESSHTAASEGSTASERPSVKDRIVVFDNNNTKAERRKSAVIEALRQTEDAPVLIESIQPKEPVSAVESSGENKDVVKSEVPKDAKGRQMVAPANHNGVQESTFGGTAHSNAGPSVKPKNSRGAVFEVKETRQIEMDSYNMPIKFLPASFVGIVDISLKFANGNVMTHHAEIKEENDGVWHVNIPTSNWAVKDKRTGTWIATTMPKNEVVINIIESNVAALSGKELPPVNNVDFDKCLVVRTYIAEDKDKVHIVNKFDEQLINLYDASLVAKKLDAFEAKLNALQDTVKTTIEQMKENMIEIVSKHLDASRLAVQKEITQHSEVSAKKVEEEKTKIVDGNTLLASHFKEIGNVEKKIQGEVESIGIKMKDIEKKIGELKTTETSQLDGIKTGTNQYIDGEYANEKKHIETEILQPINKLQGQMDALNAEQQESFVEAKKRVGHVFTKEQATETMVKKEMPKKVTALVNAVEKMGLFVNNEVDKRVDQLEPNMKDNFEKYMGNPAAIKINGVELKSANAIMAFLLENLAKIFKFRELALAHAAHRSVSVPVQ